MHKFKNLDGLRGIAALVVVAYHYTLGFVPIVDGGSATKHFRHAYLFSSTPLHILLAGNSAVTLFFVLSGFVLSVKFFQSKDLSILTSSAVRRYFRLMIPALGSILLTYIILRLGLYYVKETYAITGSFWISNLWNFPVSFMGAIWQGTYTIFFGNFNYLVSYNFNLWSMHYELFGSFFVFMIMALFGKLKKRWVVYMILAIAFIQTYYLSFLVGLVIADIWNNYQFIKDRLSQKICWFSLPFGLFLFAFYLSTPKGVYSHMIVPSIGPTGTAIIMQTIGSAIIIVSVLQLELLAKLFELKPLQFLGINSFALYVIHLAVLGSLGCLLFNQLVWRIGYTEAFILTFTVSVAFTLYASRLYTRYVDNPSIAFSKFVGDAIISQQPLLRSPRPVEVTDEEASVALTP